MQARKKAACNHMTAFLWEIMKKYIKGRVYDTDTAEKVVDGFDYNSANFEHSLFRKRNGEFFRYDWHNLYGGSITPVSAQEAREFAEEELDGDTFEKFFGIGDEDGGKVFTSISLPKEIFDKLNDVASIQHKTKSEFIAELIRKY